MTLGALHEVYWLGVVAVSMYEQVSVHLDVKKIILNWDVQAANFEKRSCQTEQENPEAPSLYLWIFSLLLYRMFTIC